MAIRASPASLLSLPIELLQCILSLFDAIDLASISRVCRALHNLGKDDQFWRPIVIHNARQQLSTASPCASFRDLYIAHHSRWFVARQQIWFSDTFPSGKLLISRYDPATGSIVAHQVVAVRDRRRLQRWEKFPNVIIHTFEPRIGLDTRQPVVKIDIDSQQVEDRHSSYASDRGYAAPSIYSSETLMDYFAESGLYASFMLCRAAPTEAISKHTRVWPPLNLPSSARTPSDLQDGFNSTIHRPSRLSEVSQCSFRVRKWVEYGTRHAAPNALSLTPAHDLATALGFVGRLFSTTRADNGTSWRMPGDITTYATLPESCYMPTPQKPYQGIWCGDYSGHGCEFILITQPDHADEKPLPSRMNWLRRWFAGNRRESDSAVDSDGASSHASAQQSSSLMQATHAQLAQMGSIAGFLQQIEGDISDQSDLVRVQETDESTDYPDVPTGRLEAIKLTGDPNVPHGEYTFIVPELGHEGFIRVADEEIFRGARIVRSAGHIAEEEFGNDNYIPSQLILKSHDVLAQYWETFGHISFYTRVDLDALAKMAVESGT